MPLGLFLPHGVLVSLEGYDLCFWCQWGEGKVVTAYKVAYRDVQQILGMFSTQIINMGVIL